MDPQWETENPVPSGRDIAEVMIERIAEVGWQVAWQDCDGLEICRRTNSQGYDCPGTYIFLSGYQDLDFHQSFLLTVCTQTDAETWVDYLAVYQRHVGHAETDVEWVQKPHRFFEQGPFRTEALHWWVDWTAERTGRV